MLRTDYQIPQPLRAWYDARERRVQCARLVRENTHAGPERQLLHLLDKADLERAKQREAAAWEELERSPVDHFDLGGGWSVERICTLAR